MFRIFLLLLPFIPGFCFAQNKISDEEFLNQVQFSVLNCSPQECFLAEMQKQIRIFDKFSFLEELEKSTSKEIAEEFISKIYTKTEVKYWDCKKLENVICLTASQIDSFDKAQKEIAMKYNGENRQEVVSQLKYYKNISMPVFNTENTYAIIQVNKCLYLFQNIKGKWIKATDLQCYWID